MSFLLNYLTAPTILSTPTIPCSHRSSLPAFIMELHYFVDISPIFPVLSYVYSCADKLHVIVITY
jgi:hypothetical protein